MSYAPIISQRPLKPTKAETVASRLMLCYPMLTNSCRVDCFGHASFVTVISRASLPIACVPCESGKGNTIPRFLFLMFTSCKRDGHRSGEWDWVGQNLAAHNSTTNPLTATALIYALGAGLPRVLAPDLSSNWYSMFDGFKYPPLESPKHRKVLRRPISFRCLTNFLALGNLRACCPP